MPLNNSGLEAIQETFCPQSIKPNNSVKSEENDQMNIDGKEAPQSNETNTLPTDNAEKDISSSNTASSASNTEFIPHIFYSINNIMKDPNNSSNQLETATGVIRHKLRSSKQILMENDDTKILLNKSISNWEKFIQLRENELKMKRSVLQRLSVRISSLEEPTTPLSK
ncbi:mediator of RNA polymerase II transcription subunit 9 [Monosporozyma unispora]|nr:mediator of RNA polymerase II transcription subunit [Kazachstania unispora]